MDRILHGKEIFEIIPFDINAPVLFFPIRHHSPICSYHLMKIIDEYNPDCILVEGPENANRLIPVLTDENTTLPVAFYYYYKDSRKLVSEDGDDYKCYYPFLNASPEYNALLKARKMNIDFGFIDLPYGLTPPKTRVFARRGKFRATTMITIFPRINFSRRFVKKQESGILTNFGRGILKRIRFMVLQKILLQECTPTAILSERILTKKK